MQKRPIVFLVTGIILSVILWLSSSACAFELGARGFYWFPNFYGDMRVDGDGLTGTKIDLGTELLVGNKSYPFVEAFAGLGRHHLSLAYLKADYSGENNLSQSINFNGKVYTAGTLVQTDANFRMLDLEYQFDLLDLENILAGFSIGVIGKIKYIEGDAKLRASSLGFDESQTFRVPVPMVGLGAHIGLLANILEARAKITGIGYSGNVFYEGLADISLTPFPLLDIHGGYRFMRLDVEDISDVYANFQFAGPYIGLTIGF